MKYKKLSQIGKANPTVLGFITGLFLCLALFSAAYLWAQGTVTITAKSCNQAPSTCVDANKKDRLYVTAESSLNSDDAQVQITNADLRMVKKNTATSSTQYPSRDEQFQCSGWNTTTAAENTANMTLRAIAGSGATGSVPYRLGVLNTGGTEFASFDGLNQRVGIGQTSPSQKLDVAGAMILEPMAAPTCGASAKGAQYFDSTANKMYYCNGTSWTDMTGGGGGSSLWTNSGTTDYLTTTTDSAAIGGTSASYKLDVTGNLRSTTDAYLATSSGNLEVGGTATARGKAYIKGSTTSQITLDVQMVASQTANPFVIESSTPSNLFVVDTNGSITTAGNATFKSPSNSTTAFQVQNSTPTTVLDVDTTNGRVGIGNASPGYTLDVTGTAKASTALISPVLKPASDSTTALQLQTSAGTNVLNVDTTNSRVGIGTASPGTTLEVNGSAKITGGLQPDYDSGWYAENASTNHATTLTHNLGVFPSRVALWFSPDNPPSSWVSAQSPVVLNNVNSALNGYSVSNPSWVRITTTQIQYKMYNGAAMHADYDSVGVSWSMYSTGYYRWMLWK